MKKPKVAYIIAEASICGGIAVVCQHANRLARRGFETCIVSTAGDDAIDWFPGQSVPVYPIEKIPAGIDIAVATWWETAYELYGMNIPRKFYFVQSDETRFYCDNCWEIPFVRNSYWFDYEFITEARWIQKWLKDNFGADAGYVPNGVDREIFYPAEPVEPKGKKPRVLIEGPADMPSKGVADAFRALRGLDCEVWYVNYRGEPDPEWRADRYFYRVPMEDMRKIYSSCDILVKLSSVEGSFGPPLEMMACGGTCVVSRVTGLEETIIPGENALVVKTGDVNGARDALRLLMEDGDLRERLIKRGEDTVGRLDWEKSIDFLEGIYLLPSPAADKRSARFQESRARDKESILIDAFTIMRKKSEEIAEISWKNEELARLNKEVRQLTHSINLKNDEINAIYLSKQWKLTAAFKEARRSLKSLIKLPFRLIRFLF